MDSARYEEMTGNLNAVISEGLLRDKKIYLFGHCDATEVLASELLKRGFSVAGILDNNREKHGQTFRDIVVQPPQNVLEDHQERVIVCIAARAYASMTDQLRRLGFRGTVRKLVEYNSFSDFSLSDQATARMKARLAVGLRRLKELRQKYDGRLILLCPFPALGDVFIMASYLPAFLEKRGRKECVIGVASRVCGQVVRLFDDYPVEVFAQEEIDGIIQAALYTKTEDVFIPHQDRPYMVNLHKALYVKRIPLEQIYCCGVFGLPAGSRPARPKRQRLSGALDAIQKGRAVIFSPYAKSVTALPEHVWKRLVKGFLDRGYQCFTNAARGEVPLEGTEAICPEIAELQSVVEWAGLFIGIRSGICDVLRDADCTKIALYPDYRYSDTKWSAMDIYRLDGWRNLLVNRDFDPDILWEPPGEPPLF